MNQEWGVSHPLCLPCRSATMVPDGPSATVTRPSGERRTVTRLRWPVAAVVITGIVAAILTGTGAGETLGAASRRRARSAQLPVLAVSRLGRERAGSFQDTKRAVGAGSVGTHPRAVGGAGLATQGAAGQADASPSFTYGFDLSQQAPDSYDNATAVHAARQVMASIPGMLEDQSIRSWGVLDPEPYPGQFHLAEIARRIQMIVGTGGVPVLTMIGAPGWMQGGPPGHDNPTANQVPPTPGHYEDFAHLCAVIAAAFPQVQYFVVWRELHGFWDPATHAYNAAAYTQMYNDVYTAIKKVRPDALVGGPYVDLSSSSRLSAKTPKNAPRGPWGFVNSIYLDPIVYWLHHNVGADFLAVDGADFTKDAGAVAGPLSSVAEYAADDAWLRRRTSLPIWWMESHLEPPDANWSASRGAAIRIAALIEMNASGAAVGMQWQPQQQANWPDEGLWTSTLTPSGGQPTVLAKELPAVLRVLGSSTVSVLPDEPHGVLVAAGSGGVIAVNTTTTEATIHLGSGDSVKLPAGGVHTQRWGRFSCVASSC